MVSVIFEKKCLFLSMQHQEDSSNSLDVDNSAASCAWKCCSSGKKAADKIVLNITSGVKTKTVQQV